MDGKIPMGAEILEIGGFSSAIQGMRNAKNSWILSDSEYVDGEFVLGEKDKILAKKLIKAGPEHRKFLRQIQVWLNINAPRYIWQELDTYKFNTKNSCSTMHKLFENKITRDNFLSHEDDLDIMDIVIERLNQIRDIWLEAKNNRDPKLMNKCLIRAKRLLFEGFLQLRTMNSNYEELRNIYHQRAGHGLKEEWLEIRTAIESLPYFDDFIV